MGRKKKSEKLEVVADQAETVPTVVFDDAPDAEAAPVESAPDAAPVTHPPSEFDLNGFLEALEAEGYEVSLTSKRAHSSLTLRKNARQFSGTLPHPVTPETYIDFVNKAKASLS
jgi:hypothetical protein